MRDAILLIIEEEIKLTTLVRSLKQLNIDVTEYLPNTSKAVFDLMGIEVNDTITDTYFQMVEGRKTANQIVTYLENCIK